MQEKVEGEREREIDTRERANKKEKERERKRRGRRRIARGRNTLRIKCVRLVVQLSGERTARLSDRFLGRGEARDGVSIGRHAYQHTPTYIDGTYIYIYIHVRVPGR